MTRPFSDRLKLQIKDICKRLGEFSYVEVKNHLKNKTVPKKVEGEVVRKRQNVGCFLPTDRQLQHYLNSAEYCVEIQKSSKHVPAKYRFSEPETETR